MANSTQEFTCFEQVVHETKSPEGQARSWQLKFCLVLGLDSVRRDSSLLLIAIVIMLAVMAISTSLSRWLGLGSVLAMLVAGMMLGPFGFEVTPCGRYFRINLT